MLAVIHAAKTMIVCHLFIIIQILFGHKENEFLLLDDYGKFTFSLKNSYKTVKDGIRPETTAFHPLSSNGRPV
jgi:hypothetical protein